MKIQDVNAELAINFPFKKAIETNSNPWRSQCCYTLLCRNKRVDLRVRPGTSEDSMHLKEFGFRSDSYYFCLSLVNLVHLERRKPFYRCSQRVSQKYKKDIAFLLPSLPQNIFNTMKGYLLKKLWCLISLEVKH